MRNSIYRKKLISARVYVTHSKIGKAQKEYIIYESSIFFPCVTIPGSYLHQAYSLHLTIIKPPDYIQGIFMFLFLPFSIVSLSKWVRTGFLACTHSRNGFSPSASRAAGLRGGKEPGGCGAGAEIAACPRLH